MRDTQPYESAGHEGRPGGLVPGPRPISTEAVWRELSAGLRRFIMSRVRDRDDAEDVLQDVFVKIHVALERLEEPERLHAWVYQIARNAIVDFHRERRRAGEAAELPDDLADESFDREAEAVVASWLRPMIEGLPRIYRDALVLAELEGLTQQETAARLGLSLSGAKSRVQRGRDKLRETLLRCCEIERDRSGRIVDWEARRGRCRCAAGRG